MTLQQFYLAIQARRRVLLGTLLACLLFAFAVSLALPKTYLANATVMLDIRSSDPVVGGLIPQAASTTYLNSQVEVLRSDRVTARVVQKLGLETQEDIKALWMSETQGEGLLQHWLFSYLRNMVSVHAGKESNVISIQASANTPALAALLANAYAQSYIDTAAELKLEPLRDYASFLDERIKVSKSAVQRAQERLFDFQKDHAVQLGAAERLDLEVARLESLLAEFAKKQASSALSGGQSAKENDTSASEAKGLAVLKAALDAQQKKVLEMRTEKDTLANLQRELRFAQMQYENITQKPVQFDLGSRLNITNAFVLNDAVVPLKPSDSRSSLIFGAALFFGLVSGLLAILLLELRDRRIRTRQDLRGIGLPVLGALTNIGKEPAGFFQAFAKKRLNAERA